ncbi:acyl-CoA thioesterase [Corynebacterium sp. A21]|uniref:acyl-CoA thioesterase n=1 Tax=Corynebacterium sp. A21 TaxID=3457318 RepID=UPI003FD66EF7
MTASTKLEATISTDIRVTDLDFQKHVGNTAFYEIFADARFKYLSDVIRPIVGQDALIALVHVEVDFTRQVHFPAALDTVTRVTKVGRTSIGLTQEMFNGEHLSAKSSAVLVLTDRESGTAIPWPEDVAQTLNQG